MVKLCICDLDGVVVDNKARFAKAEEAKQDFLKTHLAPANLDGSRLLEQKATDLYWRTAFTPSLVELDTLIDGAVEAINQLVNTSNGGYYTCVFLTSRPETMRQATVQWLKKHIDVEAVEFERDVIMKPLSQQFVKTPVWKAGTIEVLARVLGADELLVVDDEHAQQLQADLAGLDCFKVTCVTSLAEAVATIG